MLVTSLWCLHENFTTRCDKSKSKTSYAGFIDFQLHANTSCEGINLSLSGVGALEDGGIPPMARILLILQLTESLSNYRSCFPVVASICDLFHVSCCPFLPFLLFSYFKELLQSLFPHRCTIVECRSMGVEEYSLKGLLMTHARIPSIQTIFGNVS